MLMKTLQGEGHCRIIFLMADWPGRGYGVDFFEKSWEIRIPSRVFKHTRPRNETGKTKPGLPGTQDDGRSSRNSLEEVLKPKTKFKITKIPKIPKIREFPPGAPIGPLWAHRGAPHSYPAPLGVRCICNASV